MTERLVFYVEPRLRKRVVWGGIAVSIGLATLVRLTIGNEPIFVVAALVVPLLGMFLLLHVLTAGDLITMAERTRRYQAVLPYWERVLLRAILFGVGLGIMQLDYIDTSREAATVALVTVVSGLVFGVVTESISRWAQRSAASNGTSI